jgi:carbon-monoxide dehydrogenase large subunit
VLGESAPRSEDPRLLTGRGLFVDDVELPGMLHCAFVRSPHAHAKVLRVDASAAARRDGVVAIYRSADLGSFATPAPLLVHPPPIEGSVFHTRTHLPLAKDKVRYVGEPIAIVVAIDRYVAEDAAAEVVVDYEPLAPVVDIEQALAPRQPRVYDDLPDNLSSRARQTKGDYAAAARGAHLIVKRRFAYDHGASCPIETRGVVAHWDRHDERLTVWDTTQAPVIIRGGLAGMLGLSEHQVRVVAPFIGGGFGPKMMMFYPEEVLVPWISMKLARPVKWIEDRLEHFTATTNERNQVHLAEMALDADGRILGVKDEFLHDSGAYSNYGLTIPLNTQCTLLGPYDIEHYDSCFTVVFTNKTLVTPYRGAGRQHGVFVIERLLDLAARELGLDLTEIRRRNLIPPDRFPYRQGIIYQDFTQLTYDSGNYAPLLARAKAMIGYDDFARRQEAARAEGRHLGIGVVFYVEGTGIGPYEGARVSVQPDGKVLVATGVGTQGQGHFTTFAQLVARELGVGLDSIRVITGDTDQFGWGAGTFASRSAVVAAGAVADAAAIVRGKVLHHASEHFECDTVDIVLADGFAHVAGAPTRRISLAELAQLANPLRGAVQPGTEPGLESTRYFGPAMGATSAGVHAMIIEVDAETFDVRIDKYVVVHDCGTLINPAIVEGQIHGGVAQGIGNAFYEQLLFDDQGQLLNASLADYLLPTALEVPAMEIAHQVTPSPLNPLGTKGVGEAGAIPVGPLFAQAIENALNGAGVGSAEILEIPLSPEKLRLLWSGSGR